MFQYIVAGIAAVVFGGIAIREATKPTGDKVKDGDNVFVLADKLTPADPTIPADALGLRAFLAGFLNTSVKVTNVKSSGKVVIAGGNDILSGTILGFAKAVSFPRNAVTSIDRNGTRIT